MWRRHFPKLKKELIPLKFNFLYMLDLLIPWRFTKFELDRVLQSFWDRARLDFQVYTLRNINPQKASALVKIWVIFAQVFANWTILAHSEVLTSMSRSSGVSFFSFLHSSVLNGAYAAWCIMAAILVFTMKRWPCCCTKSIQWEFNSFLM